MYFSEKIRPAISYSAIPVKNFFKKNRNLSIMAQLKR